MQSIAAENNLSETAFVIKDGQGYGLRWFSPEMEVDLCGHATLASAFVLFEHVAISSGLIVFNSVSGLLTVERSSDGLLVMDFPVREGEVCEIPEPMVKAFGRMPVEVRKSERDYLAIFDTEEQVRELRPDMGELCKLDCLGIIVTAGGGGGADFVSRFFAPRAGVDEDPVTGSAHSTLVPYWAKQLKKSKLHCLQISKRGGELFCEDCGDRVKIAGKAVTYLEGTIVV